MLAGMKIDEQDLREFMQLYEAEFSEKLSLEEARVLVGRLLELYVLLARPLPRDRGHDQDQYASIEF
jgi:hypothetical protein